MNDTEQLLVLAAVWTAIAALIARLVPNWPGKITVFLVLVGVPFWELPYGYFNLHRLCAEEAKLQVFGRIAPQKSACFEYPMTSSADRVLNHGFETIETVSKDGRVMQYTIDKHRAVVATPIERVTADYCVSFENNRHLSWGVLRHDLLIRTSKDRSLVARYSVFDWSGMWWQAQASPMLGRGGHCRPDQMQPALNALLAGAN